MILTFSMKEETEEYEYEDNMSKLALLLRHGARDIGVFKEFEHLGGHTHRSLAIMNIADQKAEFPFMLDPYTSREMTAMDRYPSIFGDYLPSLADQKTVAPATPESKKKAKEVSRAFDKRLREIFSPRDKSKSEAKLLNEKIIRYNKKFKDPSMFFSLLGDIEKTAELKPVNKSILKNYIRKNMPSGEQVKVIDCSIDSIKRTLLMNTPTRAYDSFDDFPMLFKSGAISFSDLPQAYTHDDPKRYVLASINPAGLTFARSQ